MILNMKCNDYPKGVLYECNSHIESAGLPLVGRRYSLFPIKISRNRGYKRAVAWM